MTISSGPGPWLQSLLRGKSMINRLMKSQIEQRMFQGKAIIVLGPRQSGKTTLITDLLKDISGAGPHLQRR